MQADQQTEKVVLRVQPDAPTAKLLEAPQAQSLCGQILGQRYLVEKLVEADEVRQVYLAHDQRDDEPVQVCVFEGDFRPSARDFHHFSVWMGRVSTLSRERLLLMHGLIDETRAFAVVPCVSGESLQDIVDRDGALPFERAVPIFVDVCHLLAEWHLRELPHENLRLKNILLAHNEESDVVLLRGFGVVDRYQPASRRAGERQWVGQHDVRQVGMALYHALSGKEPFEDWHKQQTTFPRNLAAVAPGISVPPRLERIIFKALHPIGSHRHSSMLRLARDLRTFDSDWHWHLPRRPTLIKVAAALGAVIGAAVVLGWHFLQQLPQGEGAVPGESSVFGTSSPPG
jgi:serine/threonine protein kinase